jgi:large subunit ribosomal protein L23
MNQEKLFSILEAPRLSEKSVMPQGEYSQYVFKISAKATKPDVKKAVEQFLNVKVRSVNICNVKSKDAGTRVKGTHKAYKKAYVLLEKGQQIEWSRKS